MVTTTLVCVLITNLVVAPLTAPLLRRMRLSSGGRTAPEYHTDGRALADGGGVTSSTATGGGGGGGDHTMPQPLLINQHAPLEGAPSDGSGLPPLDGVLLQDGCSGGGGARTRRARGRGGLHALWKRIDERYVKPIFGGRGAVGCAHELEVEDE